MPTHGTTSSTPSPTEPHPLDPQLRGPAVLVVGDSSEAQAVARLLTRERVPTVFAVATGDAERAIETGEVSVVVIDIDVAHADAMAFCRHVKRDSATRLIPILQLSDDRKRDHRLAGIEAGAEAFLSKPFDPRRADGTRPRVHSGQPVHERPRLRRVDHHDGHRHDRSA